MTANGGAGFPLGWTGAVPGSQGAQAWWRASGMFCVGSSLVVSTRSD